MKYRLAFISFVLLFTMGLSLTNVSANNQGPPGDPGPTPTARPADRDRDGWPDIADNCPDQPGTIFGCPDSDGDTIPDHQDACPNQFANTSNGCPPPPQDYDGDGIPDHQDNCPYHPGPASNYGCPTPYPPVPTITPTFIPTMVPTPVNPNRIDTDKDGWPDVRDLCPYSSGPYQGCASPYFNGATFCRGPLTVTSSLFGWERTVIEVTADITIRYRIDYNPYVILDGEVDLIPHWNLTSGGLVGLNITAVDVERINLPGFDMGVAIYVTLEATEQANIGLSSRYFSASLNMVPLQTQRGRVAVCGFDLNPSDPNGVIAADVDPAIFGD